MLAGIHAQAFAGHHHGVRHQNSAARATSIGQIPRPERKFGLRRGMSLSLLK